MKAVHIKKNSKSAVDDPESIYNMLHWCSEDFEEKFIRFLTENINAILFITMDLEILNNISVSK